MKRVLENWIDFCVIHQDKDFRGKNGCEGGRD